MKLETRFVSDELWIRAFPDMAFLQSHDPRLTYEERADAVRFKQTAAADKKAIWEELVNKYGVYRAAWVVQIPQAELDAQEQAATENGEKAANEVPSFYFKWLPDRLVFCLHRGGEREPAYTVEGSLIDREGLTVLGEGDEWVQDFTKAVQVGLGTTIKLSPGDTAFEKVIVSGIRYAEDPAVPAGGLTNLFHHHQYTEGFGFLKFGTPTNNTETAKSGYSSKDAFDAVGSYAFAVEGLELESNGTVTAGKKLATDLGLEATALRHAQWADHHEPKLNDLYQKATWFALGGQALLLLLGDAISREKHLEIWEHYSRYVKAKGPYAAMKVGNQPYGILPVADIRLPLNAVEGVDIRNSEALYDQLWELLSLLMERWLAMVKNNPHGIPKLEDAQDAYTEILKILSMEAYSGTHQIRALEYNDFQEKLYHWLRQLQQEGSIEALSTTLDPSALFSRDFRNVLLNRNSLTSLLTEDLVDADRLLRSPLLSISQATAPLIRFREGEAVITNVFGKPVVDENGAEVMDPANAFSFPEDDLSPFQAFVDLLGAEPPADLLAFQYQGDTSLFTDLFFRGYANAGQLYHRDVTYDFTTEALRKVPAFRVGAIFKSAGEEGMAGEPVLEIVGSGEQAAKIMVEMPIDGTIRDIHVATGQEVQADMPLFTVFRFRFIQQTVTFNSGLADIRAPLELSVGAIHKPEGATVARGETVLEIIGKRGETEVSSVPVTAPFDGKIEKMRVSTGDRFSPGLRLFTLVNAAKLQEIRTQFHTLGQQIIAECNAIADPAARREAQTEAIRQVLDLNSYRLDAWITSLAARRIEETRSQAQFAKGIYFGAYGWVENLVKNTANPIDKATLTDTYRGEGGMIHTTSPAQAVASAIFKNSFLSYREIEEGNPFTLNLTSDRLQKAQVLLEGVRQGQQIEALLGYQLERYLHEHPNGGLHNELYILREAFPLYENVTSVSGQTTGFVQLSVIDGLKAIEHKANLPAAIDPAARPAVVQYIEKLEDVLDGSLDALFYEAGYQITQGNLSQAAAALDATKGEIEPPAIESLKTRIPGTGITHRLILGLPAPPATAYPLDNCRAFAEPVLEKWLEENIGPLQQIGCAVELLDTTNNRVVETVDLTLADLRIGYLDLLYLSKDLVDESASELELRIWKKVTEQRPETGSNIKYRITDPITAERQSLHRALEVLRTAYALLSRCRFLKSEDLTMETEPVQYDRPALDQIRTGRLAPILQRLKTIAQSDVTEPTNLGFQARLDLETAKTTFLGLVPADKLRLQTELEEKLIAAEAILNRYTAELPYYPAFELLQQAARVLFGPGFLLLPPAVGSDQFAEALQSPLQKRLVGEPAANTPDQVWGQERIENWVQGLAQVQENSEFFEDWLMVRKVWDQAVGLNTDPTYRVVQGPTRLQYPWLALSKPEIDQLLQTQYAAQEIFKNPATGEVYPLSDGTYYPDGCDCTVIYAPNTFALTKNGAKTPVYGLVVEEFSEHIPHEQADTALSFHYNAPNSEPPQAILLAVHPKAALAQSFVWSENDLRDILYDTMDLYKIRMVDTDAMQEYGYLLPMTYWFNLPRTR